MRALDNSSVRHSLTASPFLKDFVLTTCTSILSVIALIVLARLIVSAFGPEGLGEYIIFRRLNAFLVPAGTLMLGVTVTRAVASEDNSDAIVFHAVVIGFMGVLVVGALLYLLRNYIAARIFRDPELWVIVALCALFLVANLLYTIEFANNRGRHRMLIANAYQLTAVAFGPLVLIIAIAKSGTMEKFLLGLCFLYAIPGVFLMRRFVAWLFSRRLFDCSIFKSLLSYALPRIPAGLGLTYLLALGPIVASRWGGVTWAGMFGAAQSIFAISEGGVTAISMLVLPHAASHIKQGKQEALRSRTTELIQALTNIGLPVCVLVAICSREFIALWLGMDFIPAAYLVKILCIGLFAYLMHVGLRSIIDAVEKRAINTACILLAAATSTVILAILGYKQRSMETIAIAISTGLFVLGATSILYLWRSGWFRLQSSVYLLGVLPSLLIWSFGIAADSNLPAEYSMFGRLAIKSMFSIVVIIVYVYILFRRKVEWTIALRLRLNVPPDL